MPLQILMTLQSYSLKFYYAQKKFIYGAVLVALEGLNGSISGKGEELHYLIKEIHKLTGAKKISIKVNHYDKQPFTKIKAKLEREIVVLKYSDIDVENLKVEYIETKDWDDFIKRDGVVIIDTGNNYEIKVGVFEDSVNPKTETLREFPEWAKQNPDMLKEKKVAMLCTGGIQWKKSTSLPKDMDKKEVSHLKVGILQYLEGTKNANNTRKEECSVFDNKGAVSSDLSPSEVFWVERGQTDKGVINSK